MEEIVCDVNQFQVRGGALSCTTASVLCARLGLNRPLDKSDLHRILHAAGKLYASWKDTSVDRALQHWKNVVDFFPPIMDGIVRPPREFYGGPSPLSEGTFEEAIEALQPHMSAVLTYDASSFAILRQGGTYYYFDPHGAGAGAVYRRTSDVALFLRQVTPPGEFSMVYFQSSRPSSDTEDTSEPA
jgi:hypothetical protein